MVHAAGPADADLAAFVDVVVAQPVIAGRGAGGPGLGPGPVGLPGGAALHCAVGPVLVVVPAEGVELVDYAAIPDGGTVAVFGLGPIGQMAARIALYKGASRLFGVDDVPERLAMARRNGR